MEVLIIIGLIGFVAIFFITLNKATKKNGRRYHQSSSSHSHMPFTSNTYTGDEKDSDSSKDTSSSGWFGGGGDSGGGDGGGGGGGGGD